MITPKIIESSEQSDAVMERIQGAMEYLALPQAGGAETSKSTRLSTSFRQSDYPPESTVR